MRILFSILCFVVFAACKGKESPPETPVDPIFGEWAYDAPGATLTLIRGYVLKIESSGNIELYEGYTTGDSLSRTAYYRKNIGKFERNGEKFTLKYSYETCNPAGQEEIYLKISAANADRLILKNFDQSVQFTFYRMKNSIDLISTAAIEDKSCNILAKVSKPLRIPASAKAKSFFDYKAK